jgi:hypothetical protein
MGHRTEILVEAFKSSGLTQKEYCVQNGIGLDTLKYHLYKKRAAVKADNSIVPAAKQQSPAFMTFNPAFPPEPGRENSPIDITIIHGRFTVFQISAILNGIGR